MRKFTVARCLAAAVLDPLAPRNDGATGGRTERAGNRKLRGNHRGLNQRFTDSQRGSRTLCCRNPRRENQERSGRQLLLPLRQTGHLFDRRAGAGGYASGRSAEFAVLPGSRTTGSIVLNRSSVSDQNLKSIGTVTATTSNPLAATTSITRTIDTTALRNEDYLRVGELCEPSRE